MCRKILLALVLILLMPAIAPAKTEGGMKNMALEGIFGKYGGLLGYRDTTTGKTTYLGGSESPAAPAASSPIPGVSTAKTPASSASRASSSSVTSTASAAKEALQRAAEHVKYFGSPESYAQAIKQKNLEGKSLTDPEAAKAFMQSRPDLFGGGEITTATTKGFEIPNLFAIPPASGPMARIMRESSSHPLAEAATKAFYDYLRSQTGQPVTPEEAYQRATAATYQSVLGGMSYPEAKQAYDAWVQQLQQQYQLQQMQPIQQIQAQITPILDQLQREIQNINNETAPVVMNAYNQVIGMIDKVQQDLISRFEQAGQGVDPATQAALASLKETVQRQRENLMEDLSRRGLLQSGIWLEMEDRLNKKLLTEQQRLMATRLSDLQNQLNQALASLAEMRIKAAQEFGTKQIRQMEAAAQQRQRAIEALTNAVLKIQGQMAEQQRWEQEQAWERQKYFTPSWVQQAQYTGIIPPLYPGDPSAAIRQAQKEWGEAYARGDEEGMKRAHEKAEALRAAAGWPSGGESGLLTEHLMTPAGLPTAEMQRAWLPYQYPTANALLPYEMGPTPYEQQRLDLEQQRLAQAAANAAQRAAARGPSESEIKRQNLADAQAEIWNELNSGKSIYEVEAKIMQNADKYTLAGLDPMDLVDYAWYTATGAPKPKPATTYQYQYQY